jgi:flagellar hook-associated protein 3 FlgL
MAINSMSSSSTLLGQSILNIKNQLNNLQVELATGEKSTTYSGMGVGEGFAIAARSQLANITGYQNTMTNVSTTISAANTALQALDSIDGQIQNAATDGTATLNSNGQTTAQTSAVSQLSSMVGILNTQAGTGYIFSGNATNTAPVTSANEILNGNGAQAGLIQVIDERQQADLGTGTPPTGRLVISSPTPTSVSVGEDVAGSPFGLKLNSVSSTLTGATVTGPAGSPATVSIALGATNPNPGDQVSFTFNLPDGSTTTMQLTATTTSPAPAGSFTIGATPTATAANLNAALTTSISTVANTTLVAASAIAATSDFFGSAGAATGTVVDNQAATAAPITSATLLSGAAGTDSLTSGFAPGDTITVNGQTIQFYNSSTSPPTAAGNAANTTYLDLATATVGNLLSTVDSITGTSTPSTVSGGVVTLQSNNGAPLTVTSSDTAAFAALGFSGGTTTATTPPLRVSGSPLGSATSLVSGTAANTVSWYTGGTTTGSARATQVAQISSSQTVDFGIQANEEGIRSQLEAVAVFAAFSASPSNSNAQAQVAALSQSVGTALSSAPPGQQTIQDIQADLANAQTSITTQTSLQSQAQTTLQNVVSQVETVSSDTVASEMLSLQTDLQASYETTSTLAQLSLVKYLPIPSS